MLPDQPKRFLFVLVEGYSHIVLASAIEPLRVARHLSAKGLITWKTATLDGMPAKSSSGLALQPDCALRDGLTSDAVFVICGYGARDQARPPVLSILRRAARESAILGGIDMGGWLLAEAGLLDGRRATVHWQELASFEERFLTVSVSKDPYVIDGKRITAGGAAATMSLMLRLIADRAGDALAFDVSSMFAHEDLRPLFDLDRGTDRRSPTPSPPVRKAIREMHRNMASPLPLAALSAAVGVAPRSLNRIFQRELGLSPGHYGQSIRLNLARSLAEETKLSTAEIAADTGFSSASVLSRAFGRHFGRTIRDFRRERRGR